LTFLKNNAILVLDDGGRVQHKGKIMPTVTVKQTDKGKYKVLVDYVQRGVSYSTRALADAEANKIRTANEEIYGTVPTRS
jgi:hypothetical protein